MGSEMCIRDRFYLYSDIKPNPTIENVQHGVKAFQESGADCMITIGGGSSMDTGKAIGIIINNPEYADVRSLEGVAPTKKRTVFTIAVPTTGGTGAENKCSAGTYQFYGIFKQTALYFD